MGIFDQDKGGRLAGFFIYLCCLFPLIGVAGSEKQSTQVGETTDLRGAYVYTTAHLESFQGQTIEIDGKLDELVYEELVPISGFTQRQPDEGMPVSEKTEAYVFYDDRNVYVSFRCYDSEPDKINAQLENRDVLRRSDRVEILFDTFQDLRSGYLFKVSVRNIQEDAASSESRRSGTNTARSTVNAESDIHDKSWNAVWRSATSRFDEGWMAEIAIPFNILKYSTDADQTWGMQLARSITRKNETSLWFPQRRFEAVLMPSRAGILEGLTDIPQYRHLDLIPFVSVRRETSSEYFSGEDRIFRNAGFDFRYNLTANLVANLAVRPDFGQTEIDEENVSLSRWELFYPEKREFFTEGAQVFNTPLQLFFSRRIGAVLPDNSEHQVQFGGKVTGKVGKQQIGVIGALAGKTSYFEQGEEYDVESAGFFVFRYQRDILEKSNIGFITVNRDQEPDQNFYAQRAHGVDANFNFGDHVRISSQVAFSDNPGEDKDSQDKLAYLASFNYNSNLFEATYTRRDVGESFDVSQIGYYPEVDRVGNELNLELKPFINRWGIRQLFFTGGGVDLDNHQGETELSSLSFGFRQQWKNFWTTGVRFLRKKELYYTFYQGEKLADKTLYDIPHQVFFSLTVPDTSAVHGSVRYHFGEFIDYADAYVGKWWSVHIDLTARLGTKLWLGGRFSQIRHFYKTGELEQIRGLYLYRMGYNFTNKIRSRLVAQHNPETGQLTTDALVWYELTARSGLYFGFRDRSNIEDARITVPEDSRVFFKFSYLFSF